MRTIPLTQGKVAIVDDADYNLVSRFTWCAQKSGKVWYAKRGVWDSTTKKIRGVSMHHLILAPKPGYTVDHVNGDGLDNRRQNLRLATAVQQCQNRSLRTDNKSGYKGVYRFKQGDGRIRWRALIKHEGRRISLGVYDTPEEASVAYEAAAVQYYGEWRRS